MALKGKQLAFVKAYIGEAKFNATESARIAGYEGNENTLRSIASENLTKPNILKEIEKSLEGAGMSLNEIISRLAEMARGSLLDLLDDNGKLDIKEVKRNGKGYLLKELTVTRDTTNKKISYKYKIHDSQSALDKLARIHGLYQDKLDVNHKGNVGVTHSLDPKTIDQINQMYDGTIASTTE